MDFQQKYTEGIDSIYYSYMTSKILKTDLSEFKEEIMNLMKKIPSKQSGTVIQYGFVVGGNKFFSIDALYESETSVALSGLEKISSDTFLDFINYKQAIGYGV